MNEFILDKYLVNSCPICGKRDRLKLKSIRNKDHKLQTWRVICYYCKSRTYGKFDNREDAVDAWNKKLIRNSE